MATLRPTAARRSPMPSSLLPGLIFALLLSHSLPVVQALWPRPASIQLGQSIVRINASALSIRPPAGGVIFNPDIDRAVERTKKLIRNSAIAPLVVGRGAEKEGAVSGAPMLNVVEVFLGPSAQGLKPRGQNPMGSPVDQVGSDQPFFQIQTQPPTLAQELARDVSDLDEAYELFIPSDGSPGSLKANSGVGVLRGLTTLAQLVNALPSSSNPTLYIDSVPLQIQDRPAFAYRGFMLDVARHFFPLASLKRNIDTMAFVKQNVLHLHLTDAQSWPLELDGELAWMAKEGSYGPGMTYSKEDIKELVEYATDRGIIVYPEIDMPGHAATVLSTRNLTVCTDKDDWWNWANEPPSGSLDLKSPATLDWAKKVVSSVLDLFPSTPYFGTGNDEVKLHCYDANSTSDIDASLLKPFVEGAHGQIQAVAQQSNRSISATAWEEIILDFPETAKTLRNGTVVQAWTTADNAAKILKANAGVRLVHSPLTFFYLDCGRGGWLGNATQDWQFNSYCGYVSWQRMYSFDPYANLTDVVDGKKRVLGGEPAAWAETIDDVSLESTAWPRAAAAAEVFWTGATYNVANSSSTTPRTSAEALPRLHDLRYRLVELGVRAEPLAPLWCTLRPGRCDEPIG